ncbi:MAG: hypothetical protein KC561_08030 [Myxococcales bacterium]|nr:hypothetical protein [Myxococcales bacterium]
MRHKLVATLFSLLLVFLAAPIRAQEPAPAGHSGPQGTVDDEVDAFFAILNGADPLTVSAQSFLAFDFDTEGAPIRSDRDVFNERMAQLSATIESSGLSVNYSVAQKNCVEGDSVAFCSVLYSTTVDTLPETTLHWHLTLGYQLIAGGWTLVHLHNSPGLPGE